MSAYLGIDIGGSHTRALVLRDDGARAEGRGGGANPSALGRERARAELARALAAIGNPEVAACCAGAAGAELLSVRSVLAEILEELLPGARVLVLHDARLLLAGEGLDHGIALIAGTGSIAYGLSPSGQETWAGGWGWMLGDEGSGVWMVREGARRVLHCKDEGMPQTRLGQTLMQAAGVTGPVELRDELLSRHDPSEWGELAGAIFEAAESDPEAEDVVRHGASHLAELVRRVVVRMGDLPVVMGGGLLLNQPLLEAEVRRAIAEVAPDVKVTRLSVEPVEGALRLARELVPA